MQTMEEKLQYWRILLRTPCKEYKKFMNGRNRQRLIVLEYNNNNFTQY
jgi:hypothetical protein